MPDRDASPLTTAEDGDPSGAPLILLHTLGTDLTLWDDVIPHLPPALRILRLDLPGHGTSPIDPGSGRLGALISDVEATLDNLDIRGAVLLGHGLGGLIAQGLAVKRLDVVRALILSGTASKIGTRTQWETLATALRTTGPDALIQGPAARWPLPRAPLDQVDALAHSIRRQSVKGLAQAADAIAGADFYTATASLRLAALGLVGRQDQFTPPDLVRETIDRIPGSQIALIPRAGHLAMLDASQEYAESVAKFLMEIGHGQKPFGD